MIAADLETTVPHLDKCECETKCTKLLTCHTQHTEVWLAAYCTVPSPDMLDDVSRETAEKISGSFTPDNISVAENIEDFIQGVFNLACEKVAEGGKEYVFFHNLKFDGSFIINYFLRNNVSYKTFINEMNIWYSVEVKYKNRTIIFKDSVKILPFKIKAIAHMFKTPTPKGQTPLLAFKPEVIKKEWYDYVKTDVDILARALSILYFRKNVTKFTAASHSFDVWEKSLNTFWRNHFPKLNYEVDDFIRSAYRGGWVYLNPKYQGKIVDKIAYYDINSMYPAHMIKGLMPVGHPIFVEGEKKFDENKKQYPLFVVEIEFSATIKKGFLPTLQIKDKRLATLLGVKTTQYITHTGTTPISQIFTSVDFELLKKHYNVHIFRVGKACFFNGRRNIFTSFLNTRKEIKINSDVAEDKVLAKLESNSLYGKLGSKVKIVERATYLKDGTLRFSDKDGCALRVRYHNGYPIDEQGERLHLVRKRKDEDGDTELLYQFRDYYLVCLRKASNPIAVEDGKGVVQFTIGEPKYTAAAAFITAYSRRQVISTAQDNYNRFIYSDTDSIQFKGWDKPKNVIEHSTEYGLWKKEGKQILTPHPCIVWHVKKKKLQYLKGKYLRAKLYMLEDELGNIEVKGAGMTEEVKSQITFKNFKLGASFKGKKVSRQIKGGVGIFDTEFSIEDKTLQT